MPQIVETNLPQPVLLQDQRKMLCDIAGLYKLADFVYIDIKFANEVLRSRFNCQRTLRSQ